MSERLARTTRSTKDERIVLRASHDERDLIARASLAAATNMSDFVLRATLEHARDILADRREFHLSPDQWTAFVAMLDAPPARPTDKPLLHRLLTEPSMLERQAEERQAEEREEAAAAPAAPRRQSA